MANDLTLVIVTPESSVLEETCDSVSLPATLGYVTILPRHTPMVSTLAVGTLTWWTFGFLGVDIPFVVCLVFGALISPTDPIAVMGLLKELDAPRGLEAQLRGGGPRSPDPC